MFVSSEDDAYQERILNPFKDGRARVVDLDDFVFEANAIPSGDTFEACVQSIAHPQNKACVQGINHKGKHIETVIVPVPIGIGRPPLDKGEYDDTNTFYPNGNFLNSNDNTAYGEDSKVNDQDYTGGTIATMHLLISP